MILAIALQNIPEGTSVAIPMESAGFSRTQQFWAGVATSAPQPVGAVVAFLAVEKVEALLPISFASAAGALREGIPWEGWVILAAATAAFVACAAVGLEQRDARQ